ncbi:MAG: hypothetical protein KC636_39865, partial [Myxococcales bacterium]|nr:hypothetical protein [Myxococcales bacterium]
MVFYEGVAGDPGAPPPWVASAAGPEEPGLENILIVDGEGPDGAVASLFDALPTDVDEATITARAAALKAERHVSRSGDGPGPALDRGTLIGDLVDDGQELRIARGGRGGRGNVHFVSSTNRAPDHAERGLTGEAMWLRLELKLLADVG